MFKGLAVAAGVALTAFAACGPAMAGQGAASGVAQGPTDCAPRPGQEQWSQDRLDASCFVHWLYGPQVLESLSPLGDDAPRIFTQEVVGLIAAARAASAGQEPPAAFDADPLCLCQDPGGLRFLISLVPEVSRGAGRAQVSFDFRPLTAPVDASAATSVELILRKEAGGWRVDDVRTRDGWSFRRSLTTP